MKTKIQTDPRSGLYFDQWQYSIAIFQPRISDIRGLNTDRTLETIAYKKTSRFVYNNYTTEVIDNILTTLKFFKQEQQPFKLTLSSNWAYVYFNDADMISRFETQCPYAQIRFAKQAKVSEPRDVVMLKDTKYAYRTYFKSRWVEDHELITLNNFFAAQHKDNIKPCGSFKKFLKSNVKYRSHWMADHYFVDHNDPGYPLMINLLLVKGVRKTLPIVQRINN
jgi:hypothetical protein